MIYLLIAAIIFSGLILLLKRNLPSMLLGIVLFGNGVNLAIFSASKPQMGAFSFIDENSATQVINDPLPQALVLTAIVIGFALLAFLVALIQKAKSVFQTLETDAFRNEALDE